MIFVFGSNLAGRHEDGVDVEHTEDEIYQQVMAGVAALREGA